MSESNEKEDMGKFQIFSIKIKDYFKRMFDLIFRGDFIDTNSQKCKLNEALRISLFLKILAILITLLLFIACIAVSILSPALMPALLVCTVISLGVISILEILESTERLKSAFQNSTAYSQTKTSYALGSTNILLNLGFTTLTVLSLLNIVSLSPILWLAALFVSQCLGQLIFLKSANNAFKQINNDIYSEKFSDAESIAESIKSRMSFFDRMMNAYANNFLFNVLGYLSFFSATGIGIGLTLGAITLPPAILIITLLAVAGFCLKCIDSTFFYRPLILFTGPFNKINSYENASRFDSDDSPVDSYNDDNNDNEYNLDNNNSNDNNNFKY